MAYTPSRPTVASYNFQLIINDALKAYQKRTKNDLLVHPLAAQLQISSSPAYILAVLQKQLQELEQSRANELWKKCLDSSMKILFALPATIGIVGLLALILIWQLTSAVNVLFAIASVLFAAFKDARASEDNLVDIFERIEFFFRRLEIYTEVPPPPEMMDIIIRIMVEVLVIFEIAITDVKNGRMKRIMKKLPVITRNDIEDSLNRLDKLIEREVQMSIAQNLKTAHIADERVVGVMNMVVAINNRMAGVVD